MPDSEPYFVEVDLGHTGCPHCGAGKMWNVVFRPTDTAHSVMYGDEDAAQEVADDFNVAYAKGLASR